MRYQKGSTATDSMSVETEIDTNPYRDEPESWEHLSEAQLVETWYQVDRAEQQEQPLEPLDAESLIQAANDGEPQAQYTLGKMFYNGFGVDINYFRAAFWFSKAAASGNPFAQYELAKMCKFGIGVEKDIKQSKLLFENSYETFLSLEDQHPDCAIETKLAAICENRLVDLTDSDMATDWRLKTEGRLEISLPATETPASQAQMLLEQGLASDPDYICMAEMKGAEACQTQKAARTSHAVITTVRTKVNEPPQETFKKVSKDEVPQKTSESISVTDNEPSTKRPIDKNEEASCEDEAQKDGTPQEAHESVPITDNEPSTQQPIDKNEEPVFEDEVQKGETPQEGPEPIPEAANKPVVRMNTADQVSKPEDKRSGIDECLGKTSEPVLQSDSEPVAQPQPITATCAHHEETASKSSNEPPKTNPCQRPDQTVDLPKIISTLKSLHAFPGDSCATLDGDRVVAGIIDRIEIYSNAVLISVEEEDLRRPYPVSEIGETLFVGTGFMDQAEKVVGGEG